MEMEWKTGIIIMNFDNSKGKGNSLDQRVEDIYHILSRNNAQFTKGVPSAPQLQLTLEHSSHCYDQLHHITQDLYNDQTTMQISKITMNYINKILNSNKLLLDHMSNWIGSYEVELEKRIKDKDRFEYQLASYNNTCKLCHKHVEEVVLREAKRQIVGPTHWRELFDRELTQQVEEEQVKVFEKSQESKEYTGSVSYLAKVIKDMEGSISKYNLVEARVERERNYSVDDAYKLLDELIRKMKERMGEKCLPKLNQIIRKQLLKSTMHAPRTSHYFQISEQYSMSVDPMRKKSTKIQSRPKQNTDNSIEKLTEEIRKLTVERDTANQMYISASSFLDAMGHKNSAKQQLPSHIARKNNSLIENIRLSSISQDFRSTIGINNLGQNQNRFSSGSEEEEKAAYKQILYKTGKQSGLAKNNYGKLFKRFSEIHLKRMSNRDSELGRVFDRTIEEYMSEPEQQGIDAEGLLIDLINQHVTLVEEQMRKDVGCQWLESDFTIEDGCESRRSSCKVKRSNSQQKKAQKFRSSQSSRCSKGGVVVEDSQDNRNSVSSRRVVGEETIKDVSDNEQEIIKKGRSKGHAFQKDSKMSHFREEAFTANQTNKLQEKKGSQEVRPWTQNKQYLANKQERAIEEEGNNRVQEGITETEQFKEYVEDSKAAVLGPQCLNRLAQAPKQSPQLCFESTKNYRLNKTGIGKRNKELNHLKSLVCQNRSNTSSQMRDLSFTFDTHKKKTYDYSKGKGKHKNQFQNRLKPILQTKDSYPINTHNLFKQNNGDRQTNSQGNHSITNIPLLNKTCNFQQTKTIPNLNQLIDLSEFSKQRTSPNFNPTRDDNLSQIKHLYRIQNNSLQNNGIRKQHKKQTYFNQRIVTQGHQSNFDIKNKKVSNFLFQPEHLSIFGGLSESYTYQTLKITESEADLSHEDKVLYERLMSYLSNLRGFKRSIYQNIVFFLQNPFQTIEKTTFQFNSISNRCLNKIVLKLLLFHKKKCSSLHCPHIQTFCELIGFTLS